MAQILVTGAGIAGLSTAMLLAGDGHDVTVLERDPAAPPSDPPLAWDEWERRGVNQFRLLHFFLPRFRVILEAELPRVVKALDDAGALRFNPVTAAPTEMTGGGHDDDDDFETLTGRRPVVESAVARVADETPGVTVRRGVGVAGLVAGTPYRPGVPHVTGVRTEDGEVLVADLVVDTTGRRSPLPHWLEAIGARRPAEELEDSGFVYFGRHFRSTDGSVPVMIGPPLQDYGSISALTLPADNGTWGVGVITSARDSALRCLRDVDRWSAVVRNLPLAAHWADGVPVDDQVLVMAKIEDRHRAFWVDDQPVATGVVAVGDSWACTNPSLGRGASIALTHAVALRDQLRSVGLEDPMALASAFRAATVEMVEPFYRSTLVYDRHRLASIDATIGGEEYPGDVGWEMTQAMFAAAGRDPDCFRALVRIQSLLSYVDDVFADQDLVEKVIGLGRDWRTEPQLGPTRAELLSIVAA